jgi:hypothetical protein
LLFWGGGGKGTNLPLKTRVRVRVFNIHRNVICSRHYIAKKMHHPLTYLLPHICFIDLQGKKISLK